MVMYYTIGEMAKLLHIATSTLRYYDKEGLLPFVERSSGGIRMFKEIDYEWLCVIECLKGAGMPLKDIKEFVHMSMQGDVTMQERLKLILKQREAVQQQMAELQRTLDVLDYKKWYYETAVSAGTTKVPREMSDEEMPPRFVPVRKYLKDIHSRS
ncbi:MerR family transcriptional regulator [Phascolarctobacterium sp.]|uniref:MerR family transcriptional regulator n=2 Tax=Phascolarctobacterium sp. TaxID=2049039 RepID=UPI00386FADB4